MITLRFMKRQWRFLRHTGRRKMMKLCLQGMLLSQGSTLVATNFLQCLLVVSTLIRRYSCFTITTLYFVFYAIFFIWISVRNVCFCVLFFIVCGIILNFVNCRRFGWSISKVWQPNSWGQANVFPLSLDPSTFSLGK